MSTNTREYFLKKLLLGFEHETLIKFQKPELKEILKQVDDLVGKNSCDQYMTNDTPPKRNPLEQRGAFAQRVARKSLLNYFKSEAVRLNHDLCFKTLDAYGLPLCGDQCDDRDAWKIVHDESVKMAQSLNPDKFERKFALFYHSASTPNASREEHDKLLVDPSVVENIEIVSPVLAIADYKEKTKELFEVIDNKSALVYFNNSKTSQHVHFSCDDHFRNPQTLFNICTFWWYFESLFIRFVPRWRRKNRYCTGTTQLIHDILEEAESDVPLIDRYMMMFTKVKYSDLKPEGRSKEKNLKRVIGMFQKDPDNNSNRYAGFNLFNLLPGNIGTIEVRIKHGSTDVEELFMFIDMFALFFCAVMSKNKPATEFYSNEQKACFLAARNNHDLRPWVLEKLFDLIGGSAEMKTFFANLLVQFDDTVAPPLQLHLPQNSPGTSPETSRRTRSSGPSSGSNGNGDPPNGNENVENSGNSHQRHSHSSPQPSGNSSSGNSSNGSVSSGPRAIEKTATSSHMETGGSSPFALEKGMVWLFCYGSNSTKQLKERLGVACTPYRGRLPNFVRVFAGYSSRWDGSIASLCKKKGDTVYGSVVKIPKTSLELLDEWEGGYSRVRKFVIVGDKRVKCYMYIKDNHAYSDLPSTKYLKAIRTMLDETRSGAAATAITIRKVDKVGGKAKVVDIGEYNKGRIKLFK